MTGNCQLYIDKMFLKGLKQNDNEFSEISSLSIMGNYVFTNMLNM